MHFDLDDDASDDDMASSQDIEDPHHPFLDHLIALLSVFELGKGSTPIPRYDGASNWQTQSILRSIESIGRRMMTAEDAWAAIKASEEPGRETKKRRSVGDSPPLSSGASSSSTTDLTSLSHATMGSYAPRAQSPFFTPNSSIDSIPTAMEGVLENGKDDVLMDESSEPTPSAPRRNGVRPPSPMTISLDGVVNPLEKTKVFNHTMGGPASAPPSSHIDHHVACPSCGKVITDSVTMARIASNHGPPVSSPMVIPPGPLVAAAVESGMSAVEELRLLKAQVQDVAKVCNAVARGDLSQKITVPVQGPVMVQLKEVINTMVSAITPFTLTSLNPPSGGETRSIRARGHPCQYRSRNGRVSTGPSTSLHVLLSYPPQ